MLSIDYLVSGGIITNYFCTSRCRHCLYRCSPSWPKDYMDKTVARAAFKICKEHGCSSVHVGGGEPFLNLKGLLGVLEAAKDTPVNIEYIETNSSWYVGHGNAVAILKEVRSFGADTLLVSASPFHLEFIPFGKVMGVVDACRKVGLNTFIWTQDFFSLFKRLDPAKRYSIKELEKVVGRKRLHDMIASYWIHPGGRALETFFADGMLLEEIFLKYSGGCRELADTSHFHVDLYGNYVPGLCSGLAIRVEDLGRPLNPERYPIISILYQEGVSGLYRHASAEGFRPAQKRYGSKCGLCFEMRKFFVDKGEYLSELAPVDHYRN